MKTVEKNLIIHVLSDGNIPPMYRKILTQKDRRATL